jgi:small subunit ribosomal protein S21
MHRLQRLYSLHGNYFASFGGRLRSMIARIAGSDRQNALQGRVAALPSVRRRGVVETNFETSGVVVVKLTLRDRESAQEAVRRFRKLVERSGIKKEMRVREFYEKPSETKRRARLRAQRRARRERFFATH